MSVADKGGQELFGSRVGAICCDPHQRMKVPLSLVITQQPWSYAAIHRLVLVQHSLQVGLT
jgi:hypothetical protein